MKQNSDASSLHFFCTALKQIFKFCMVCLTSLLSGKKLKAFSGMPVSNKLAGSRKYLDFDPSFGNRNRAAKFGNTQISLLLSTCEWFITSLNSFKPSFKVFLIISMKGPRSSYVKSLSAATCRFLTSHKEHACGGSTIYTLAVLRSLSSQQLLGVPQAQKEEHGDFTTQCQKEAFCWW